jgi:hypothetical protein
MVSIEKEVNAKGKYLAERLKRKVGGDWTLNTWYNFGWCFDVTLGSISVKEIHDPLTEKVAYIAYISDDIEHPSGSLAVWMKDNNTAKTPEKAVKNALKNAQDYINSLQYVIDDNKMMLNREE